MEGPSGSAPCLEEDQGATSGGAWHDMRINKNASTSDACSRPGPYCGLAIGHNARHPATKDNLAIRNTS